MLSARPAWTGNQLGEPGRPMQVLAGDTGSAAFIEVALLQTLHASTR